jgi:hypothetical protein
MSIIKPPVSGQEAIIAMEKTKIVNSLNSEFKSLKRASEQLFAAVWHNPKATPAEILESFGTDAHQLFVIASTIKEALNAIQPGTLSLTPPVPYTINLDGSVSVD